MSLAMEPSHEGLGLLLRALAFAATKHRAQRRKDPEASPYINHPIEVAALLHLEAGVCDPVILSAAVLHDTLEDTDTTVSELERNFGTEVAGLVAEVSDDKSLPKSERKRLQIEQAPHLSPRAALVKLADKICNLRDVASRPPAGWSLERRREYFDWALAVVERLPGIDEALQRLFEETHRQRP